MPWILCRKCEGTAKVPVDLDDPEGEREDCPVCAAGGNPGHVYREYLN